LGFAGVSLSMASGACASTSEASANTPPISQSQNQEIFLGEEEIFDTSLSTFFTFDKENGGATPLAQQLKLAGGGCGHGGGGGCGCGHGGGGGCGCGHGGGCGCGHGGGGLGGFHGGFAGIMVGAVAGMAAGSMVAWPTWVMGGVAMHRALTAGLTHAELLVTPSAATVITTLPIISVTIS
jgi:hypothetical protein